MGHYNRLPHRFCGVPVETTTPITRVEQGGGSIGSRVEALEEYVRELKGELQAHEDRLERFMKQFQ